MKTYILDILPKIQRFSKKLDDITVIQSQHWVLLNTIKQHKEVYIFRPNNQLLISCNGVIEKASWDYLGNDFLMIDTANGSFLLKHGFLDDQILTLKLDSSSDYLLFVNENKNGLELNTEEDVLNFLESRYLNSSTTTLGIDSNFKVVNGIKYRIKSIIDKNDFFWGNFKEYKVEFENGRIGEFYKGGSSQRFFYMDLTFGKVYCRSLEVTIEKYYKYLVDRQK